MFAFGISGAVGSMSVLLGIFLTIAVILIIGAILIYTKPARVFMENGIAPWKAFVPVYNMWAAYSIIAKMKWLFWAWLLTSIPRMIFLILVQINSDAYNTALMISFCVGYLTMLPLFTGITDGTISNIYTTIVLDLYALAPVTIVIAYLLPGINVTW